MRYDTTGPWRSINAAGRVTINRTARDAGVVLSAGELDARIKTGKFRISQFTEAVRNLERLKNTAPTAKYVERVVRERVADDVVRF